MNLTLANGNQIEVQETVFGCEFNNGLVHQSVVAFMAGAHQGTKAQKSRAQKSGSGRKPWRQKGTGRARAGSIRSPIWRGGGRTFAAMPRDYSQKINRKMYRKAICTILSELNRRDCLVIVEQLSVEVPKTKLLLAELRSLSLDSVLIVDVKPTDELFLASRNLPQVGVLSTAMLDPANMLRYEKVLLTTAAVKRLEYQLQ